MFNITTHTARFETPLLPFRYYSMAMPSINENINISHLKGFGSDNSNVIATKKALSELMERYVYYLLQNNEWPYEEFKPINYITPKISNGFAAHENFNKAKISALCELIERSCLFHMIDESIMIKQILLDGFRYYRMMAKYLGLDIKLYLFDVCVPSVFVIVKLRSGGCLFASSCSLVLSEAIESVLSTLAIRICQYNAFLKGREILNNDILPSFKHWIGNGTFGYISNKLMKCTKCIVDLEVLSDWNRLFELTKFYSFKNNNIIVIQAVNDRINLADDFEGYPLL